MRVITKSAPLSNRAYSLLDIKSAQTEDGGRRIIRGMATTPAVDRVGDIIEPLGVQFKNPLPFLWQHQHDKPIGNVEFGKPTAKGVPFIAELPVVTEEGALRDRIEEAWQSIKIGLVRAVSIGFRPIEYTFLDDGGVRFVQIEVYELSAVTIPANADCQISSAKDLADAAGLVLIKSFDVGLQAASGQGQPPAKITPAAAGKSHQSISLTPKEGKDMKTLAEQIAALEAKRAANTARMTEVMQKGMEEGRTTDESEQTEFDTLEGENGKIDGDLKRLKSLQAIAVESAQRVEPAAIRGAGDGAALRTGNQAPAQVQLKKEEKPGVRFARLAKVRAVSRMDAEPMAAVAERMYGRDSETYALVKAAVVAGSNASGNWAADLTGAETSAFADFAAFLRPATILGKFGRDGVPDLRHVPFREPLISQTSGGAGYWVGEGKPKPLTSFGFDRRVLTPLKVANIAVLTEENIRSSNPSSEMIVRDALRDALTATQDLAFIDPTNAGTSEVKPASITYGAAAVLSTGTDADDVRMDVRALFQHFIDADNPPESGVWIMSTTNALALSQMVNALSQREFPSITMRGGTFEGMPVIASRYAGSNVALVNASDIYEADDGEVTVDMSREASLEMKDGSMTQDSSAGTGVALVSLWQSNLVGLRGEKTINWSRRRDSAVAYLHGVTWGGAVPVS